jgi:hypothetical protein
MKRSFPLVLLTIVSLAFSGCVSSKYKLAKPDAMTPPLALNLAAKQPPLETMVNTVIIYQGPGSWKREAYWDEYVLSLANRGDAALTVESATLVDFQNNATAPGDDPWKLDNAGKTAWQRFKSSQTGNLLALGAGTVGVVGVLAGASLGITGFLGPATATSVALNAAATATLFAAPVYAITIVAINSHNKKQVVAEFNRRRLALPVTLAPAQVAQGSLFFRVSPGPQRLTLHCRVANEPRDVTIDLAPLASLHFKEKAPPAAAPK